MERFRLVVKVSPDDPGSAAQEAKDLLYAPGAPTSKSVAATVAYLATLDGGASAGSHVYTTLPVFLGELWERAGNYLLTWRGPAIKLYEIHADEPAEKVLCGAHAGVHDERPDCAWPHFFHGQGPMPVVGHPLTPYD